MKLDAQRSPVDDATRRLFGVPAPVPVPASASGTGVPSLNDFGPALMKSRARVLVSVALRPALLFWLLFRVGGFRRGLFGLCGCFFCGRFFGGLCRCLFLARCEVEGAQLVLEGVAERCLRAA